MRSSTNPTLPRLAILFLKLGILGFGGPAAHLAMMEDEVVCRRGWIRRQYFLDLIGATNLIPGPNSTEMAIHLGYRLCGWQGLLVSGLCFILPAAVITGALAWGYLQFGRLPEAGPFLVGIKASVIAIILAAVLRLGRSAITSLELAVLTLAVAVAALLGGNQIGLILAGGITGMIWIRGVGTSARSFLSMFFPSSGMLIFASKAARVSAPPWVALGDIGFFFCKVGSVLFGSGYVLVAFLTEGLVRDQGWLTYQQLLDAVAAGQLSPGPVLSTATFVGYLLRGWEGAAVATGAIFLPSFLFVLLLNPFVSRLRCSSWAAAFLDSVNASAVSLMAAALIELGRSSLSSWQSALIAGAATLITFRFRVNSGLLIVGSSVLGWILS